MIAPLDTLFANLQGNWGRGVEARYPIVGFFVCFFQNTPFEDSKC